MTFSPRHGENSDLHNIFTTHVGIFMTKFTPHVVKIHLFTPPVVKIVIVM